MVDLPVRQVLFDCESKGIVSLHRHNRLSEQGARYKGKFWPYRSTGILLEHPDGGFILEIHIENSKTFMDALRQNDYFMGKTEAKIKNAIKDCLQWTLGFK